jgi:Na+-driven multidrug efflux pump
MTNKNKKPIDNESGDNGTKNSQEDQPLLDKKEASQDKQITVWRFTKMLLKYGLAAAVAFADYYILTYMIRYLAKGMTIGFRDALDYFTIINDIFVFTFNYGLMETIGIFGSQALSSGDKNRPYQLMNQGNLLAIFYMVILLIPLVNYSEEIFDFLGFEAEIGDAIASLQLWLAPSMVLKMINDNAKTFLYVHGKNYLVSIFSIICLALAFPIAWFFCGGATGVSAKDVAVTVFLYQLLNFCACRLAMKFEFTEAESKETLEMNHCIRHEIDWFTWEWLKNSFSYLYTPIFRMILLYIVELAGSTSQIDAFYLLMDGNRALVAIAFGFWVSSRCKINKIVGELIGKKDLKPSINRGLEYFNAANWSMVIIGGIFGVGMIVFAWFVTKENRIASNPTHVTIVCVLFGIAGLLKMLQPLYEGTLRTLDQKFFLIVFTLMVSLVIMPFPTYKLAISNDYALLGLFICVVLEKLLKIVIFRFMIQLTNWKNRDGLVKELVNVNRAKPV